MIIQKLSVGPSLKQSQEENKKCKLFAYIFFLILDGSAVLSEIPYILIFWLHLNVTVF